jgi:hypothetical protein
MPDDPMVMDLANLGRVLSEAGRYFDIPELKSGADTARVFALEDKAAHQHESGDLAKSLLTGAQALFTAAAAGLGLAAQNLPPMAYSPAYILPATYSSPAILVPSLTIGGTASAIVSGLAESAAVLAPYAAVAFGLGNLILDASRGDLKSEEQKDLPWILVGAGFIIDPALGLLLGAAVLASHAGNAPVSDTGASLAP